MRLGLIAPADEGHPAHAKRRVLALDLPPRSEGQLVQPTVEGHNAEVERAIGHLVRLVEIGERLAGGEQVSNGAVSLAQLGGDKAEVLHADGGAQRHVQAHKRGVRPLLKGEGCRKRILGQSEPRLLKPSTRQLAGHAELAKARHC